MSKSLLILLLCISISLCQNKREMSEQISYLKDLSSKYYDQIFVKDSIIDAQKSELIIVNHKLDSLTQRNSKIEIKYDKVINNPTYRYYVLVDQMDLMTTHDKIRNLISHFRNLAAKYPQSKISQNCEIQVNTLQNRINTSLRNSTNYNSMITPKVTLTLWAEEEQGENEVQISLQYQNKTLGHIIGVEVEVSIFTPYDVLVYRRKIMDQVTIAPLSMSKDQGFYTYKKGTTTYEKLRELDINSTYKWQTKVIRIIYADL